MEYVVGLTEGRRAVIYDEGNQIMIAFIGRGRTVNFGVLEKEYHSALSVIQYENKIYIAYITVSGAIAWMELGGEGRVILYASDIFAFPVKQLCLYVVDGRLFLFFLFQQENTSVHKLQYIEPLIDRSSHSLLTCGECVYEFFFIDGKYWIQIANLQHENVWYEIKLENEKLRLEKYEQSSQEQVQNKNEEIEQLKTDFTKQYEELSNFTKQVQDEGRKWRELYYKCVQNMPKNT